MMALLPLLLAESLTLSGPARPSEYMEASGRRAAFLGRENGSFEAWVYPLKVFHGFELLFELADYGEPIPAAGLSSGVEIRPESSTVRYSHASFTSDVTWLVPIDEPGGLVLVEVDASDVVGLRARFHTDLKLMWPAALGGQYSYWDEELSAYVITESTRRHAAIVGSPFASRPPTQPAHNLPDAPTELRIEVREPTVPIAIAASVNGLPEARATYRRLLGEREALARATEAHYRELREERTRIDTPDDALDRALEWGKVALDKGFVCNPQLGCGLVAGLGPSGRSERPGFGWFFGGDAFINLWAIGAYGDFETAERALRFLRDRQRDDGKMMHELSQGAVYIPWFEQYPYGYYHADTTPLYIVAVRDYVRLSGDLELARDFWPSLSKAFAYCLSTDEDGDGLMDNSLAGLGAVETGSLRSDEVLTDVYLAAVWTEAVHAMRELAQELGESRPASVPQALAQRFRDDDGIPFALLRDGTRQVETTAWPAFGLWRGLISSEPTLDALASSRLGADWGVRMLSRESALYDHKSYNNGAVWPFLTGMAALALYANDHPHAGWLYLEGTKELTFLGARGFVPELLSGDRLAPVDAAVPHQLFSTSGLVSPLLRGLVGYEPGRLAPKPPPGWDRFKVENLRHAQGFFDFEWQRFRGDSEDRIELRLEGTIGPLVVELSLPGGPVTWSPEPGTGVRTHEVTFRPGIEIEPIHAPLRPGDRSRRLRILEERFVDGTYTARLEGRRRTSYELRARIPFEVESVENGTRRGNVIDVVIPDGAGDWATVDLVVKLRR
ncbi:MAG TPA: GH116 family glycosyl hydrolase [Vicinamibacteria bacterium]|nr:GH116 family glycosyl hydrolase [Vicinamibacteria bacterium]